MKNLLKTTGLLTFGFFISIHTASADNNNALDIESNIPEGITINQSGEKFNLNTKAIIDEDRPVGGTSIRYYSSTASAMQPNIMNRKNYYAGGCSTAFGGILEMDESVDLPQDAKIVSFTALGKDDSSIGSVNAYLARVPIGGNYFNIINESTGIANQPGRFSIGGFLDHAVNSDNEGLLVRLSLDDETGIEVCGFRIGYVPPDVASDVIFVNNFYR